MLNVTLECCHILWNLSIFETLASGDLDDKWTSLATVAISLDMSYALDPLPIITTTCKVKYISQTSIIALRISILLIKIDDLI